MSTSHSAAGVMGRPSLIAFTAERYAPSSAVRLSASRLARGCPLVVRDDTICATARLRAWSSSRSTLNSSSRMGPWLSHGDDKGAPSKALRKKAFNLTFLPPDGAVSIAGAGIAYRVQYECRPLTRFGTTRSERTGGHSPAVRICSAFQLAGSIRSAFHLAGGSGLGNHKRSIIHPSPVTIASMVMTKSGDKPRPQERPGDLHRINDAADEHVAGLGLSSCGRPPNTPMQTVTWLSRALVAREC